MGSTTWAEGGRRYNSSRVRDARLARGPCGTFQMPDRVAQSCHQALQEPIHSEARNCGTLFSVHGTLRGALTQRRGDPSSSLWEGSMSQHLRLRNSTLPRSQLRPASIIRNQSSSSSHQLGGCARWVQCETGRLEDCVCFLLCRLCWALKNVLLCVGFTLSLKLIFGNAYQGLAQRGRRRGPASLATTLIALGRGTLGKEWQKGQSGREQGLVCGPLHLKATFVGAARHSKWGAPVIVATHVHLPERAGGGESFLGFCFLVGVAASHSQDPLPPASKRATGAPIEPHAIWISCWQRGETSSQLGLRLNSPAKPSYSNARVPQLGRV